MSNEYQDWHRDIVSELNTRMRDADFLPDGWTSTFIPAMKRDLVDVLGSYVYDFIILDVKEKYGAMRAYWAWADRDYDENEAQDRNELTNKIEAIISKYEKISENTCAICGKPATKFTTGWVWPVCDEHEYL